VPPDVVWEVHRLVGTRIWTPAASEALPVLAPLARERRVEEILIWLACTLTRSTYKNEQGATAIVIDRDRRREIEELTRYAFGDIPRQVTR